MYIDIDEDQIVTLEFSSYNCDQILDQFKKWNDKKQFYDENDVKKLKETLDMLGNVTKGFEVEANVDEVYVNEDDLSKLDETYNDGYKDAMDLIKNERTAITQLYSCLFQKIEHLAYGYGNQDPLTKEDIQTIRELLQYRFRK